MTVLLAMFGLVALALPGVRPSVVDPEPRWFVRLATVALVLGIACIGSALALSMTVGALHAVTGVADPLRGQVVKATVVLTADYKPSDDLKLELQDHVKKVTAPYKYPRIIEFVGALPKTISGKIRRIEIREKDENRRE